MHLSIENDGIKSLFFYPYLCLKHPFVVLEDITASLHSCSAAMILLMLLLDSSSWRFHLEVTRHIVVVWENNNKKKANTTVDGKMTGEGLNSVIFAKVSQRGLFLRVSTTEDNPPWSTISRARIRGKHPKVTVWRAVFTFSWRVFCCIPARKVFLMDGSARLSSAAQWCSYTFSNRRRTCFGASNSTAAVLFLLPPRGAAPLLPAGAGTELLGLLVGELADSICANNLRG